MTAPACDVTYTVTIRVPDSAPTDGDVGVLTHEVLHALDSAGGEGYFTLPASSVQSVKLVGIERVPIGDKV